CATAKRPLPTPGRPPPGGGRPRTHRRDTATGATTCRWCTAGPMTTACRGRSGTSSPRRCRAARVTIATQGRPRHEYHRVVHGVGDGDLCVVDAAAAHHRQALAGAGGGLRPPGGRGQWLLPLCGGQARPLGVHGGDQLPV